jgi:hypothetical protein
MFVSTVFKTACHWSPSWVKWIQPAYFHLLSLRSISILSSHLYLDHPGDLLPLGFLTKTQFAFLMSPTYASSIPSSWLDHLKITGSRVRIIMLFTVQFSPASCHFLLDLNILRNIYSQTPSICILPLMTLNTHARTHTHTKCRITGKIIVLCI